MTREERCKLAIERNYTYDPETGLIYNRYGKIVSKPDHKGYIQLDTSINKKKYKLKGHHFAWYCFYGNCNTDQIDHINGIRHDNRICNLRNVNQNKNQWNRTKAKGYYWDKKANKWRSQIKINSKKIYLGYYITEQEARNAYLAAKEIYHKF